METSKCRALITTLERGSIAGAAEVLGYTTSGISRMMASLETELGFPLLVRGKHGVKATDDCREILPLLAQLATLGETCEQEALYIRGIEKGRLTVGCAYRSFYEPLTHLLRAFSDMHPGIRVEMIVRNSTPLVIGLAAGKIDMAIISKREGEFEWAELLEDPMVALVPADHPLADADCYPIERFAEDSFIELYPDEESDNSRVLAQYGVHPNSHNAVLEAREARELVAVGLGVALMNNVYANRDDARIRCLPLSPTVNIPIGVASPLREFASPAARAFREFALPQLREAAIDAAKAYVQRP